MPASAEISNDSCYVLRNFDLNMATTFGTPGIFESDSLPKIDQTSGARLLPQCDVRRAWEGVV